jgi:hypothetical protein
MATAIAWRMWGDILEACNCTTTCPCNFGSDPTQLPCEAILGFRIQDGQYGNIRLDGLNFVLYFRIPGNAFQGGWTLGVYLDQQANQEQVQALGSILSGQAGGWFAVLGGLIAQHLEPKQVPITFETVNGEYRITVPGLLEVQSERVPHPMPGQPSLDPQVSGLAVPFHTGPTYVRRSSILKLTDPNLRFEYSERSALIGQFDYRGS